VSARVAIVLCLALSAAAPCPAAARDSGLVPCEDSNEEGYAGVVDAVMNTPRIEDVVVSFTAFNSFAPETGVRTIQTGEIFVLRSVEFDHSVWHMDTEK